VEDDEDGEDVAGHGIMAKKPIAAMVRLHDDSDDDDGAGEESDEVESDSREKATPPRKKKKQKRFYQDDVENEEDNNQAEWSAAVTRRTSASGGGSTTSPSGKRKTNGESILSIDRGFTLICPMSKAEGLRNQELHIAERVRAYIINRLFHKIKFVTNDAMVHEAMIMIMDNENVPQEQRYAFQMV
jgi:hypothetical protein